MVIVVGCHEVLVIVISISIVIPLVTVDGLGHGVVAGHAVVTHGAHWGHAPMVVTVTAGCVCVMVGPATVAVTVAVTVVAKYSRQRRSKNLESAITVAQNPNMCSRASMQLLTIRSEGDQTVTASDIEVR